MPSALPEGVGRYVPAGADVLLQIHYHKAARPRPTARRSACTSPRARRQADPGGLVIPPAGTFSAGPSMKIPAGEAEVRGDGHLTIASDAHLSRVIPHMHWLGKDSSSKPIGPTARSGP